MLMCRWVRVLGFGMMGMTMFRAMWAYRVDCDVLLVDEGGISGVSIAVGCDGHDGRWR
jgi:hypothetical protein